MVACARKQAQKTIVLLGAQKRFYQPCDVVTPRHLDRLHPMKMVAVQGRKSIYTPFMVWRECYLHVHYKHTPLLQSTSTHTLTVVWIYLAPAWRFQLAQTLLVTRHFLLAQTLFGIRSTCQHHTRTKKLRRFHS